MGRGELFQVCKAKNHYLKAKKLRPLNSEDVPLKLRLLICPQDIPLPLRRGNHGLRWLEWNSHHRRMSGRLHRLLHRWTSRVAQTRDDRTDSQGQKSSIRGHVVHHERTEVEQGWGRAVLRKLGQSHEERIWFLKDYSLIAKDSPWICNGHFS